MDWVISYVIEFHPIHKKSVIETLITYIGNKFMNYPTLDCILTGKVNLSFFGINLINEKINNNLITTLDHHHHYSSKGL